jgi:DNA-binding HxlR family transcriptional regulator
LGGENDLRAFLKNMSKRGFVEVLSYVDQAGSTHYNDVHRFAMEKKLVESRASVTTILNTLTRMGLLERTVLDARPIRTAYKSTKKGKTILRLLEEMGREIG